MYVISYFKNADESLYLAESKDGYSWKERNDGKPVFASSVGTKNMRDPFLYQDKGGLFHLVWTDGWGSRSIGYACSSNLTDWSDEKLIPVMEHMPVTQNTWAPEIYYDTAQVAYRIVWSSTVEEGPRNHRIWSVTTTDFNTFSEAKLFFDPGYNVIDANVTDLGDCYFMLYKDERLNDDEGAACKAIRSCYLDKGESDRPNVRDISELLTFHMTEGPTLYNVDRDGKREWIMLVDRFRADIYDAYRSFDLRDWELINDRMELPSAVKHATVIKIDEETELGVQG
ncbi:glycoside hydrolase family 43 protein [Paenibacillus agaridevorans]|uniref:glycoside hydrolase family 43 protein n=1 Tax=Paenibacillus agaridevorans TaxID=171404 RepID=UPI001BE3FC2C|nr:glycoside hydrolase family 43 protein [Paenibacillus agaridevorans]